MTKSSKSKNIKNSNIIKKTDKLISQKVLINEKSNISKSLLKDKNSPYINKHISFKNMTREQKLAVYERRTKFNFACSLSMMILAVISFVLFIIFSILLWNKTSTITDKTQIPSCFMSLTGLPFIVFIIDIVINIDSIIDYVGYLKLKPEEIKDKKMLCAVIFTLIGIFFSSIALAGSISLMCWTAK